MPREDNSALIRGGSRTGGIRASSAARRRWQGCGACSP